MCLHIPVLFHQTSVITFYENTLSMFLCPSDFPNEILYSYMLHVHLIILHKIALINICCILQIIKLPIVQLSALYGNNLKILLIAGKHGMFCQIVCYVAEYFIDVVFLCSCFSCEFYSFKARDTLTNKMI